MSYYNNNEHAINLGDPNASIERCISQLTKHFAGGVRLIRYENVPNE